MSNPIVDFSKQTKGFTITNTSVLGVVGVPLSIGGSFTAIAQPFGTSGTAFYVTITGYEYKFSQVYDTANLTFKIGGVDVSGNSATAICTQLRDEVLFLDASSGSAASGVVQSATKAIANALSRVSGQLIRVAADESQTDSPKAMYLDLGSLPLEFLYFIP